MRREDAWGATTSLIASTQDSEKQQQYMSDFLQSIDSGLQLQGPKEAIAKGTYAKTYRAQNAPERSKAEEKAVAKEIQEKEKNAGLIEAQEAERSLKMRTRLQTASGEAGLEHFEREAELLSAFMTGKKRADTALLRGFILENKKTAVLKTCIKSFMALSFRNLDISSEKKLAGKAKLLANLNEKFEALRSLIILNPKEYAELDDDLRRSFEESFGQARILVEHYRLKKAVMTDEYYRKHANRDIGTDPSLADTEEKKILSDLIRQSEGWVGRFLKRAENLALDGNVEKLSAALKREGVTQERVDLEAQLQKRRKEIEKRGISARMDRLAQESGEADAKDPASPGILSHAAGLKALNLTGDPEKDLKLLPSLMDQMDITDTAAMYRKEHQSAYYLEQSDRQISLCDIAITSGGIIKQLQTDLLIIGQLTERGTRDVEHSREEIELHRQRYQEDLALYLEMMAALNDMRNTKYVPDKDVPPEDPEVLKGIKADAAAIPQGQELILKLTEEGFSDKAIYDSRNELATLKCKCSGTETGTILDHLLKRATVLWMKKRLLNVEKAIADQTASQKDQEDERIIRRAVRSREGYEDEAGKWHPGKDDTLEPILKLRAEAEKQRYDLEDLKEVARHYSYQYEWTTTSKPADIGLDKGAEIIVHIARLNYNEKRRNDLGAQSYERLLPSLENIPEEFADLTQNKVIKQQHGPEEEIPPVELTKYFKDNDKLGIRQIYDGIMELLKAPGAVHYPPELMSALEAIKNYSKLQIAVTADSVQLELACLDKFRQDVWKAIKTFGIVSHTDPVMIEVLKLLEKTDRLYNGDLRFEMSEAEFRVAKEQPAIYTMNAPKDLTDSNMKDLPLFTHAPNISDINQGLAGDCYFLAAVGAMLAYDPEAVRKMFCDLKDGTVLVRLYVGFDENNRRVDDVNDLAAKGTTLKPVYIRVRKDYETGQDFSLHCMWIQLLEKAYASRGANHKFARVDENGQLYNFHKEISSGDPEKILMHLTGRKGVVNISNDVNEEVCAVFRKRYVLNGIPGYMHDVIWDRITDQKNRPLPEDEAEATAELIRRAKEVIDDELSLAQEDLARLQILLDKKDVTLTPEEKQQLLTKFREAYLPESKALTDKLRLNLTADDPTLCDSKGRQEPSTAVTDIKNALKQKKDIRALLKIIDHRTEYYPDPERDDNMTREEYEQQMNNINSEAKIRNRAIADINPGGRYSDREMSILHLYRNAVKNRRGGVLGCPGHCLTVLDIQLKNGKWFVLVRDVFNSFNYRYVKNQAGELEGKYNNSLVDCFFQKRKMKFLNRDAGNAAPGASWWELRDLVNTGGWFEAFP